MLVLGIDQSYTQTGIALVRGTTALDIEIVKVKSMKLQKLKCKTLKRKTLEQFISHVLAEYSPDMIICERIRTFSKGFLSTNYIKSTGAIIATIVDACYPMAVMSADTRSWKSRVIGRSKGDKSVSSNYVLERFGKKLNDDAADAVCIAIYGVIEGCESKLLKVET